MTIDRIFKKRKLKMLVRPYEIQPTSENCGLVEFLKDSMSIDSLKKKMILESGQENINLGDFYRIQFGKPSSKKYKDAINNLVNSLAAYSLICYVLWIKDRHNGNILLNLVDGSIVHIDFGFILTSRKLNFE